MLQEDAAHSEPSTVPQSEASEVEAASATASQEAEHAATPATASTAPVREEAAFDSEEEDDFDFAALTEAQRIAGGEAAGSSSKAEERKKQRGGNKESKKIRKRLKCASKTQDPKRQDKWKAVNSRSVFITNLPFKATEKDIREWLSNSGPIEEVKLSRDKATTRALGFGHVRFGSSDAASSAVETCDKAELLGRVLRVAPVSKENKVQFELPSEIKDDVRALMKEAYEGSNISTIKDAWQKRHPGIKLDTTKWGFKNFSTAMKAVEGVQLEHHAEKKLTYLAFFPRI